MKKNLKLWYKVFVSWEWLETVFLRKFLVSLECKNSNYLCCLLPKEREKLLVSDITLAIRNELPASLVFPQSGTTTTSPMQFTQTLMNKTGLGFCPESSIFGFLRNWTKNFPPKYLCWQTNFWRAKFLALSAHCQLTCVKSQKSKRDIKSDLFISTRILIFIGLYLYFLFQGLIEESWRKMAAKIYVLHQRRKLPKIKAEVFGNISRLTKWFYG